MSNLSELLPAGGAAKELEAVASGTLPNGSPVILNANGTVTVVSRSDTALSTSIPSASAVVFNSGSSSYAPSVSFDPNTAGKFVIAYYDNGNSNYGTAIVGTISGTTISFGSEYVFNAASTEHPKVAFDPNTAGRFVVVYRDMGNLSYCTAVVGTVSGTAISFGSEYVFRSNNSNFPLVAFDPSTADEFVVIYNDTGNTAYGTATVGTISGTSISFSGVVVFSSSGQLYYPSVDFDPSSSKFVVSYMANNGSSNYGKAVVGTLSGTAVSFGSEVVFNAAHSDYTAVRFDPNTSNKLVIAYQDNGNSGYGTAIVGTVSGTSISFGSEYVFNSGTTYYTSMEFDPSTANKLVVAYRDGGNSYYGTATVGTVSGTAISFGSEYVYNSASNYQNSVSFDPNTAGKFVVAYRDGGNSSYGTTRLGQIATTLTTSNLTTENFAGTSTKAFTNGQTATIVPQGGVTTNQSSLTIGTDYYVQIDGTLATTADSYVTVVAGKAISTTSLILKGNS